MNIATSSTRLIRTPVKASLLLMQLAVLGLLSGAPPVSAHIPHVPNAGNDICPFDFPEWRLAGPVDGVIVEEDPSCAPDSPDLVAAAVKGTNRVSPMVLMESGLSRDAVVKGDDLDGDGDPDEIHIRLEIIGVNEGTDPQLIYEIAPGVRPAFWAFAPKTSGMATERSHASYLMRMPSPVVRVEQGDRVRLTVENTHYLPHTIHLHGTDHPYLDAGGEGNDGVPLTSELPILPGEQRTYDFSPRTTGTMFYHCHVQPQVHILMGLQGMFVIEENRPDNRLQTLNPGGGKVRYRSRASREAFDGEFDLQYQELDRELHEIPKQTDDPRRVAKQTNRIYDVTDRVADYYLLNGMSFPYTLRESQLIVRPDRRYRLRILNAGSDTVSLHTHGHKVQVLALDGAELPPRQRYYRDVLGITAAQRVDAILNTTDDGLNSYGAGVWLFHDHHEAGVTTDGMGPGGDLSLIVYRHYLGSNGFPETQGVRLEQYFEPAFYQGRVPIWDEYADPDLLGEPLTKRPWVAAAVALLALLAGLLLGRLAKRRRRGDGVSVLALGMLLGGLMAAAPAPAPAQAMQDAGQGAGSRSMDMPGMDGPGTDGMDGPGMNGMDMGGMRMRRSDAGLVMNANATELPPGCRAIAGERSVTVHAGTEMALRFPGTMFTYDTHDLVVPPCTRLTVTFVNEDHIRHQFMVHDLPVPVYPMGMFSIEVNGPAQETGTFITPSGTRTLRVHCGVPQHEEKGMKAQLRIGGGNGNLGNIPGISRPEPGYGWRDWLLLGAVAVLGFFIAVSP